MAWHELKGTFRFQFAAEKNKYGQRPMSIEFESEGGAKLKVMGVRFAANEVLNAQAVLPGGQVMRHTSFSPELQLIIRKAREGENL